MNAMVQFLLDDTVGFFPSSPGNQDALTSARWTLLQTFPLIHLLPYLSILSLHPPSHAGTQSPVQPTPVVTLVFLFPGPVSKPKACIEELYTSVLASTPINMAEDSGNRGFGVASTEPGTVRDLASPVLLMGKVTTWARASLALLGCVPQGQCALAATLWVLRFSTPELFQAALHGFPSKGLWNVLLGLFTWLIVSSATPCWEAPPCDDFFGKLMRRREQK